MDPKVLSRAVEIKHTATGRVLTAYLQEKLNDAHKQMTTLKDIDLLRQVQGRAQLLDELIKFFNSESDKL